MRKPLPAKTTERKKAPLLPDSKRFTHPKDAFYGMSNPMMKSFMQ